MKRLLFLLFFSLSMPNLSYPIELREIPFKDTPVHNFAIEKERLFFDVFPIIYLEENFLTLDDYDLEKLISIIRDRNLGPCFEIEEGRLKDFCKFYVSIRLSGVDSEDLLSFKEGVLGELGKLAYSISFLKAGKIIESRNAFFNVKDRMMQILFADMEKFFLVESKENLIDDKISLSAKSAIAYKLTKENINILDEDIKAYLDEYLLNYLLALDYFKKKDYGKAADLFLFSARKIELTDIALYNAVYSYVLSKEYNNASRLLPYLKEKESKKLSLLINFGKNKREVIDAEDYWDDEDFTFALKIIIRSLLEKGSKVNFARSINIRNIRDDELAFLICLGKTIDSGRSQVDISCQRYNWKNPEYISFLNNFSNYSIPKKENIKIIESFKLFNHFPFSKYYADYFLKVKNTEKARYIYEKIIREERNVNMDELLNVYINLSKIYREKGSYFTAKKVIEEALERVKGKDDLLRLELLSIIYEQEDWEELLWRAEAYLTETEDEEIKKELQKFIQICYEKLGKIMNKEKK